MSEFDQVEFDPSFATNPEQRCPCILLLDTSASMSGARIEQLNQGLLAFKSSLASDSMAIKRVEIAIVTFGPVNQLVAFTTADAFEPPTLHATGDTPMGAAIRYGLELVRARKAVYKTNGVDYLRPVIFLITDGGPTDEWRSAAAAVREGETARAFTFFAVGVEGADMETLRQISPPERTPLKLKGLAFQEMFLWLSGSLKAVSSSSPGQAVSIDNPAAPSGWATIG